MANERRPADTVDIINLRRDPLQRILYDLFIQHFAAVNVDLSVTVITRKYEMRLDMLCSDLYGSVEYIGALMKINDIFNPFSVKLADIIFYLSSSNIALSDYTDPKYISQQKDALVNALKTNTIPEDRKRFLESLEKPFNLPPTIAKSDAPKIVLNNNKIFVAPDLFAKPTSKLGTLDTAQDSGLGNVFDGVRSKTLGQGLATDADAEAAAEDIKRVLVSRIIRSGDTTIADTNIDN